MCLERSIMRYESSRGVTRREVANCVQASVLGRKCQYGFCDCFTSAQHGCYRNHHSSVQRLKISMNGQILLHNKLCAMVEPNIKCKGTFMTKAFNGKVRTWSLLKVILRK